MTRSRRFLQFFALGGIGTVGVWLTTAPFLSLELGEAAMVYVGLNTLRLCFAMANAISAVGKT